MAARGPGTGGKAGAASAGTGFVGQLGGIVPFVLFSFWLFIGWAGWAITIAGLSAAQKDVYGGFGTSWAINSNYPALKSGQVFRLDWFILFFDLVVLGLVTISVLTLVLVPTRVSVVGFLAVATVLTIISANNFYNVEHNTHGSLASRARATFAGFIIQAVAELALIYHLGLQPESIV